MHPKLVAAPGQRRKPHPCLAGGAADDLPIGLRRAAMLMADHLARAVRPIGPQGQIDMARVFRHLAHHPRDIGFLRPALFKLLPQKALRLFGAGEDDDP